MGKIVPVLIALIGLGVGVGAGVALKPAHEVTEINPCGEMTPQTTEGETAHESTEESAEETPSNNDFVKMNNQFVIPVVTEGKVGALVVLSLSLEVAHGAGEDFYQREPKLRDAFLQVLFDHANAGGFDGVFTDGARLTVLRRSLREVAQRTAGPAIIDVLVTEIVRQDI